MNAILAQFYFPQPAVRLPIFCAGGRNTDQSPRFSCQFKKDFSATAGRIGGLPHVSSVRMVTAVIRPEPDSGLPGNGRPTGDREKTIPRFGVRILMTRIAKDVGSPVCQFVFHSDGRSSLPGPTHFPRSSALSGWSVAMVALADRIRARAIVLRTPPRSSRLRARSASSASVRRFAGAAAGIFDASGQWRE